MRKSTIKMITTMTLFNLAMALLLLLTAQETYALAISTVFFWGLFLLVQRQYFKLAASNPGFLENSPSDFKPKDSPFAATDKLIIPGSPVDPPNQNQEVNQNQAVDKEEYDEAEMTEVRVCIICEIDQPLRSKHCLECGKCVALHDHHCPYVGVCIGERNRRQFFFYLVSQCALLWWAFAWVNYM